MAGAVPELNRKAGSPRHNHRRTNAHALKQVRDVLIVHANAAIRGVLANPLGAVRAVDRVPDSVRAATPIGLFGAPPGMTSGKSGLSSRTSSGGDHAGRRCLPATAT